MQTLSITFTLKKYVRTRRCTRNLRNLICSVYYAYVQHAIVIPHLAQLMEFAFLVKKEREAVTEALHKFFEKSNFC
jgi:hypothetical protein